MNSVRAGLDVGSPGIEHTHHLLRSQPETQPETPDDTPETVSQQLKRRWGRIATLSMGEAEEQP